MSDRDIPATPVKLATAITDAQKATAHRDALMPKLEEVCRLLDEVRRDGLTCNFNIGVDPSGRQRVMAFDITKSLL